MTLDVQFDYKYYTTEIMTSAELNEPLNQQLIGADVQDFENFLDIRNVFP
jgi:hypothetical protein